VSPTRLTSPGHAREVLGAATRAKSSRLTAYIGPSSHGARPGSPRRRRTALAV